MSSDQTPPGDGGKVNNSNVEKVKTVLKFLERIFSLKSETKTLICFRGEFNVGYENRLCPSVMRDTVKKDAEHQMLKDLFNESPNDFASDRTMLDKLVRAQHYGLPTRLLDVTVNPLVALYFACYDNKSKDNDKEIDGVVYAIDIDQSRIKDSSSDTVSILCNLALLNQQENDKIKQKVTSYKESEKTTGDRLFKEEDYRCEEMGKLLHFIKEEKPYFLSRIKINDLLSYFFIHPKKRNNRIIAQSGAFLIAGFFDYKKLKEFGMFKFHEIIIDKDSKESILEELDRLNINKKSLFPEISYASEYIKEKYKTTDNAQQSVDSSKPTP